MNQEPNRRPDEMRPLNASEPHIYSNGHCHDGEKCNAETFCDCPCRACVRVKRGEFSTR